ncbi:LysR family transcriptional regulator [Dongia sp.]|uniref:LysR family transcriptional regulator n=1 Tax=Dongia sp. TaxID=1977262 RepID=UPI003750B991
MDRFESMSAFVAVVEAGGFSAAARKLGMPVATVSRKVSELEALLQASLINRSTRKIALTQGGQAFYESSRRLLEDLGEAERAASGEYRAPRGELVMTAPIVFGRLHVVPVVVEFLKQYPEVDVRLLLDDQIVNLVDEQVDLAVRISELPDSSMMATRIATIRPVICASPAYLSAHGMPRHPEELADHDCIMRSRLPTPDAWPFRVDGTVRMVPVRRRLVVTTAEASIEAALAGAGLTKVFCYQVAAAERQGRLVTILREFEPEPMPLSLVYSGGRIVPMKLRAFLDFAIPHLKKRLQ